MRRGPAVARAMPGRPGADLQAQGAPTGREVTHVRPPGGGGGGGAGCAPWPGPGPALAGGGGAGVWGLAGLAAPGVGGGVGWAEARGAVKANAMAAHAKVTRRREKLAIIELSPLTSPPRDQTKATRR